MLPEWTGILKEQYKEVEDTLSDYELPDGSIYNGNCIRKPFGSIELNGIGSISYTNGDKYKGIFKYGRPLGWGIYFFKNGHKHKGYFDDIPNGIGYLNEDYDMAVGNFTNGRLNGWAICYRNKIFKFGYWREGILIKDYTPQTLWIRYEISNHRIEYKGNLIQMDEDHTFIRFGIPEKPLAIPTSQFPLSHVPKMPAYGFEFFKDGTVKVGVLRNHDSGEYMLCKKDGTIDCGKWKENIKTSNNSSFDLDNPENLYDENGIDVFKKC